MFEIGKMHKLKVISKNQAGFVLNKKSYKGKDGLLLPHKQVPQEIKIDDEVEVFVYTDSEERITATLHKPKVTLGELAVLKVVDTTSFGAFLDWGLDKDLLLPTKEQIGKIEKGYSYLVGLFVNSSSRISATMKIYEQLSTEPPYKENNRVQGTVYSINKELGAFVAVDNKYHAMIPNNELHGIFTVGDQIDARVKKVRQDGKLELSLRQEAYNEIGPDARRIMEKLKYREGILRVDDNSSPEQIKAEFNMSKSAFKRAVGRLLKEGAIKLTDKGIELMWK